MSKYLIKEALSKLQEHSQSLKGKDDWSEQKTTFEDGQTLHSLHCTNRLTLIGLLREPENTYLDRCFYYKHKN